MQKLLPGMHNVRLVKKGYFTWEKNLTVRERMATKAQNVILFPENISFSPLMNDIREVFVISNSMLLMQMKDNRLVLFETENSIFKDILNEKDAALVGSIDWIDLSPNKKRALILSEDNKYYILYLDTDLPNKLYPIRALGDDTEKPEFNGDNQIYYIAKGKLRSLNFENGKNELIKYEDVIGFALYGDSLYTLEDGFLVKTNIYIKTKDKLTKTPFVFEKGSDYRLKIIEGRVFLIQDNRVYYLYDNSVSDFDKVIESINRDVVYKTWSDKVLFVKGNELWLMLLKDFESPFFKQANSFVFLARFSEVVDDASWIDDDYFVALIDGKARISEIDNRDRINYFNLDGEDYAWVWFNKEKKNILVLKNGQLSISSKILP